MRDAPFLFIFMGVAQQFNHTYFHFTPELTEKITCIKFKKHKSTQYCPKTKSASVHKLSHTSCKQFTLSLKNWGLPFSLTQFTNWVATFFHVVMLIRRHNYAHTHTKGNIFTPVIRDSNRVFTDQINWLEQTHAQRQL